MILLLWKVLASFTGGGIGGGSVLLPRLGGEGYAFDLSFVDSVKRGQPEEIKDITHNTNVRTAVQSSETRLSVFSRCNFHRQGGTGFSSPVVTACC